MTTYSGLCDIAVVGPWGLWFGRAMLNMVRGAGVFEGVGPEAFATGDRLFD